MPGKSQSRKDMLLKSTASGLIQRATDKILSVLKYADPMTPQEIASNVLAYTNQIIAEHNQYVDQANKTAKAQMSIATSSKGKKSKLNANPSVASPNVSFPFLIDLTNYQIASIIATLHHVALINMTSTLNSSEYAVLGLYQEDGPDKGIYNTNPDILSNLARSYQPELKINNVKEVMSILRSLVPVKKRADNPDLVPVNNGIFDYRTKQLLPFSSNQVFISKSHVNYINNAKNPKLTTPDDHIQWDVVSWMKTLSDDPEIVTLLWQILGAIIRPNVSWDKSAWLYSTHGNNGKGTLCELMRNLCGAGSYAKISLNDFSQDYMLTPLMTASAIITDENDVGTYIDKAANLKAVETGDVITINRKFKDPVSYQFKGFMVQCLNEFPKVKDRSESFYRRQIFIPMTKNFKGHERKYIKQDYLKRQDVLEYVLYHVLHDTNYYELSIPKACENVMGDYKSFNDPIRDFLAEIVPECQWNLLPFNFLYDLYLAWMRRNVPNGKPVAKNSFIDELRSLFTGSTLYGFTYSTPNQIRSANKMTAPEPLIREYHLSTWINPKSGGDPDKMIQPILKSKYRGLIRV